MNSILTIMFVASLALVITLAARAQPANDSRAAAARQLHQLFDEHYRWQHEQFPERAMARGDYTNAHRIADNSLHAIEQRHEATIQFFHRLTAIDRQLLSENDLVNYELFALELQNAIDGHRFRTFLAPIGGRFGPQQRIPQMGERVRFNSGEDYENYLKRLEQVPRAIDNVIELLGLGLKEGRTPSRVTLLGVPQQFAALLEGDGLRMLARPFERMPATISVERSAALRARFDQHTLPAVHAAMAKLAEFFEREYVPKCRESIAAIDWPEGEDYYNFQLRVMTTTELTAREIHEIGLSEVARIKAEMMEVIRTTDFYRELHGSREWDSEQQLFNAFVSYLRTDRRFYYDKPEDLLAGYRNICKIVDAKLPEYFKVLPRLPYGVEEIPAFMAPQQTTAYYQFGDIRNAQPGYFMANTYQLDQRPKYEMITLAMHEAVPGHHLQIALAQEMESQPEFRKDAWFTAFGEGWALYSERLAIEMGLLEDPYDDFGRLTYEMWRACRLVVDPGMHALGWTRERAIAFMTENTALSELNIVNEVDRYIAWPAQATAYKIGELKVRELRERAEREFGATFDIREFHDVVLAAGTIPLGVLERRVNEWIARSQR